MKKNKKIIVLTLAILISILSLYTLNQYIMEQKRSISIYRVKDYIKKGELITSNMIVESTVSRDAYDNFATSEFLIGKYASTDLLKNQILRTNMVTSDSKIKNPYLRDLSLEMTLVSIPVDLNTAVGGIIEPNTYVNVMGTYYKDGEYVYTRRILENVKVIAIKNDSGKSPEEVRQEKATNLESLLPSSLVLEIPLELDTSIGGYSEFYVTALPYDYVNTDDRNPYTMDDLQLEEDMTEEGEKNEINSSDRPS